MDYGLCISDYQIEVGGMDYALAIHCIKMGNRE